MITSKELKEHIFYDETTGQFTRIKNSGQRGIAGTICNCKTNNGHIQITVKGRTYPAHRLAWLYIYGEFPKNQIDHINNIKTDNRIINLRESTNQQNSFNKNQSVGISGLKGVYWNKKIKKWISVPVLNYKKHYLGQFDNKEDAYKAYVNFCKENHGEFFCNSLLNNILEKTNGMV